MQLQTGIYIIITFQIVIIGALNFLIFSSMRTREDLKIIRRRVTGMNSHVEVISDLLTKSDRDNAANIEANRYRAAHPELWKWEPEQPTRPEGE